MQKEKLGRWLLWGNCATLVIFYLGLDAAFRVWEMSTLSMLMWGYMGGWW